MSLNIYNVVNKLNDSLNIIVIEWEEEKNDKKLH